MGEFHSGCQRDLITVNSRLADNPLLLRTPAIKDSW
jgi:hypothetical protein